MKNMYKEWTANSLGIGDSALLCLDFLVVIVVNEVDINWLINPLVSHTSSGISSRIMAQHRVFLMREQRGS